MRTLFLSLALILALAGAAFGQNVRYTVPFPSVSAQAPPFLQANLPPNAPIISWCHSPANAVPCTNYSTTFQGNGTACPNGAQDTPDPNALTSACQSTGDAQGNIGVWSPPGTYDFTVCIMNNCLGPYTVTIGAAGGGGGTPGGSNTQLQFNNNGSFGGLANVAAGSALVSNGISQPPVYQPNLLVSPTSNSVFSTPGGLAASNLNVNFSSLSNPYSNGWDNFNGLDIEYNDLGGWAQNYLTFGYSKKDFLSPLYINLASYGLGQKYAIRTNQNCFGLGDCGSILNEVTGYGCGPLGSGDEGCVNMQIFTGVGKVEYTATITSGASTGATSLTLTPGVGGGTLGDNRYLLDSTRAIPVTISAFTGSGSGPTAMTVTTTGLGASTVSTTLSANVGPCTPCTITPASMTGISNGMILVMQDNELLELVKVISTGVSTFTANLTKPHATGAGGITGGGAAGYFIEISANNGAAQNTLHWAWPIVSSASNTSLQVWMASNGAYQPGIQGAWRNSAGQNGGVVYPGAEVYSVQQAGVLSNTITVSPNVAAWSNGDTVIGTLYPAESVQGLNFTSYTPFPTPYPSQPAGFTSSMSGVPNGPMMSFYAFNTVADTLYSNDGGYVEPPLAAYGITGMYDYGVAYFNNFPNNSLLMAGCLHNNCSTAGSEYVIKMFNVNNTFDFQDYDPLNMKWVWGTGLGSGTTSYYALDPTGFYQEYSPTATLGNPTFPWGGVFTTNLTASGTITGTASNASQLLTGTWNAPGASIGSGTAVPGTSVFTNVTVTGTCTGCSSGAVTSFNTRFGVVTPTTGDYSVSQVTGAAPLAGPTFTGTVAGITPSMVGLGNVTNAAQALASIHPNTPPAAGYIPVGNSGGTAYAPVGISGDASVTSAGVWNNTKINGITVTGVPSVGYVPTATSSTAATWQADYVPVPSVFGRTGAIVATANDYSFSLLSGTLAFGQIPTGGSGTTYLRGDGTWNTPTGAGNVSNVGTPTNGLIAQWTGATTIQGIATTGTGSAVLAASPTLSGTVTISGLATGCATITTGVLSSTGTACGSGAGMTYPAGTGIAVVTGGTAWGTTLAETGTGSVVLSNAPTFTGTVVGLTAAEVGLGNVTNNVQTQAAVVPNTLPAAGQVLVGNAGGTAYAPQTISGDAALTAAGVLTITGLNSLVVPTSAEVIGSNGSNQLIPATLQGNGAKVQLSSGTTATNDCVKFDANGNTVDAGVPCASSGMVYPSAGIANSTGSAWTTPYTTTGTGTVLALATSPTFVTPTLGAALATSINGTVIPATPLVTSAASLTQYAPIVGTGSQGSATIAATGTSGAPLLSGGSGANPAYGALNLAGGSSIITGQLPIADVGSAGLSASAPVTISSAGAIAITGAAGKVLAGATPAFTAGPTLGASGTLGSVTMGNATSGTLTLQPAAGVITGTVLIPSGSDTLANLTGTQTLTGKSIAGSEINSGSVAIANGGTGQTTAAAAFNALSPMTTLGDTIYGGASGAGTRLGIGSAGCFLYVNSTIPGWNTRLCDSGTVLTYTGTGGISSTALATTGAGAGMISPGQGAVQGGTANAWNISAPATVTGTPIELLPGAAATGFRYTVNSSGTMTDSIGELSGDCTTSGSKVTTCTKTNSVAFGTLATTTTSAPVIALFTSCSGTQYLGADGACHTVSGSIAGLTANGPAYAGSSSSLVSESQPIDVGPNSTISGTGIDGRIHTVLNATYSSLGNAPIIDARGYAVGSTVLALTNPFDGADKTFTLLLGNYTLAVCVPIITSHTYHTIIGTAPTQKTTGGIATTGTVIRAGTVADGCPTNFPGATGALIDWTATGYLGAVFPHGPFNWYTTTGAYQNIGTKNAAVIIEGAMTSSGAAQSIDWTLNTFGGRWSDLTVDANGLANFGIFTASEEEHSEYKNIVFVNYGLGRGITVTQVTNGSTGVTGVFPNPSLLPGSLISFLAPITAASEASTTVTITSTLNPGTGTNNVTIAGVTPAGYNGTWSVTSSGSTSFQFTTASGLGAGTVFGTATTGVNVAVASATGTTLTLAGNFTGATTSATQTIAWAGNSAQMVFDRMSNNACAGTETTTGGITTCTSTGTGGTPNQAGPGNNSIDAIQGPAYPTVATGTPYGIVYIGYGLEIYITDTTGTTSGTGARAFASVSTSGVIGTPVVSYGGSGYTGANTHCVVYSPMANASAGLTCTPTISGGVVTAIALGGTNSNWTYSANAVTGPLITRGWGVSNADPYFADDYFIGGVSTFTILHKQCQGLYGTVGNNPYGGACIHIGDGNSATYGGMLSGVQAANETNVSAVVHIGNDLDAQLTLLDINQIPTSTKPIVQDDRTGCVTGPTTPLLGTATNAGVAIYSCAKYEQGGETFYAPSTATSEPINLAPGIAFNPTKSGDFGNLSGVLQLYDGTNTKSLLACSSVAPTITSGFGTGASVTANGQCSFSINVGTGTITNPAVLSFPAAAHGWRVSCSDVTTAKSAALFMTDQTASTTTSATIKQFTSAAAGTTAWLASDVLECTAFAN